MRRQNQRVNINMPAVGQTLASGSFNSQMLSRLGTG